MVGDVADMIIANNPAYSGFTRNQVMQEWGASILLPTAGGEVSTGWTRSLDGSGALQLTHMDGRADRDYTTWRDSSYNGGSQDLMAITLSVPKSQLDFNNNRIFDASTESIYVTTQPVPNAFIGTTTTGFDIVATGNSYNVIPEPTAMSLILGGAVALLALKKLFIPKYSPL